MGFMHWEGMSSGRVSALWDRTDTLHVFVFAHSAQQCKCSYAGSWNEHTRQILAAVFTISTRFESARLQTKVNALARSPNNRATSWLIKSRRGVLWYSLYAVFVHFSMTLSLKVLPFFPPRRIWKGRRWCFCRQRVPLVLSMQPVMNSSLFVPRLCFLTASRCEEQSHDTNHRVSRPRCMQQTQRKCSFFFCFYHPILCKKAFDLFCMTKCDTVGSL